MHASNTVTTKHSLGCLEIYAECCHFLGMDDESTEAYYQAYYLCKLIGRKEDLEITRNEAKNI